ncbi:MAG: hypothetical protein EP330_29115 [Deltaproteobacteria bacterium]|nr:MAG: hypothetical protein EP330_29115 [Deltaproteobacteria bacterium]
MLALLFAIAFAEEPAITLDPGLLVDLRAFVADHKQAGLQLQRIRPAARGQLLDGQVRYVVQAELAGEAPSLLDAVIQVRPIEGLSVQGGRFLVPYSRSQLTPVPKLQYHGFSPSADAERHGRDVGVQVAYDRGLADVRAGVFRAASAGGGHPLVVGRAAFDLVGEVPLDEGDVAVRPDGEDGFSVGFGARLGGDLRPSDLALLDSVGGAVDLATRLGPTRWQAEGFLRRWEDGVVQGGGYLQGSVCPVPKLELGSRVDLWRQEGVDAWTVQGLGSWYAQGHHARLSLQAQTGRVGDGEPTYSVALQPQVWI